MKWKILGNAGAGAALLAAAAMASCVGAGQSPNQPPVDKGVYVPAEIIGLGEPTSLKLPVEQMLLAPQSMSQEELVKHLEQNRQIAEGTVIWTYELRPVAACAPGTRCRLCTPEDPNQPTCTPIPPPPPAPKIEGEAWQRFLLISARIEKAVERPPTNHAPPGGN